MATEPERPIEKLLRDYAQKRREDAGAPLELHPTTRRLLQGEVARQFGNTEPKTRSFSTLLTRLWPRLAWGVALLVVVAVGSSLWMKSAGKANRTMTLARNERSLEKISGKPRLELPAAPPAIAPTELTATMDHEKPPMAGIAEATDKTVAFRPTDEQPALEQSHSKLLTKTAAVENKAPIVTPEPENLTATEPAIAADEAGSRNVSPLPQLVATPSPAAQPTGADSLGSLSRRSPANALFDHATGGESRLSLAPKLATQGAGAALDTAKDGAWNAPPKALKLNVEGTQVQNFAQVSQSLKVKSARVTAQTNSVLVTFQVQQTGQNLRIVDSDGSVYTGYLQAGYSSASTKHFQGQKQALANAVSGIEMTAAQGALAMPAASQQMRKNYSFRVAGLNRSLNLNVVFAGNLSGNTEGEWAAQTKGVSNNASAIRELQSAAGQSNAVQLLNSQISGKVTVGDGAETEIVALPAKP